MQGKWLISLSKWCCLISSYLTRKSEVKAEHFFFLLRCNMKISQRSKLSIIFLNSLTVFSAFIQKENLNFLPPCPKSLNSFPLNGASYYDITSRPCVNHLSSPPWSHLAPPASLFANHIYHVVLLQWYRLFDDTELKWELTWEGQLSCSWSLEGIKTIGLTKITCD